MIYIVIYNLKKIQLGSCNSRHSSLFGENTSQISVPWQTIGQDFLSYIFCCWNKTAWGHRSNNISTKLYFKVIKLSFNSLNEMQAPIFYTVHNPKHFLSFIIWLDWLCCVIKGINGDAIKTLSLDSATMQTCPCLLCNWLHSLARHLSTSQDKTLESNLRLPRNLKPPYQGLGNAQDEVRALLNTEILIDGLMKYPWFQKSYLPMSTEDFSKSKETRNLLKGDFHQLLCIGKAKPLCVHEKDVLDLWTDNLKTVKLTDHAPERQPWFFRAPEQDMSKAKDGRSQWQWQSFVHRSCHWY